MKVRVLFVAALAMLPAACASPEYPAPTEVEALEAYKEGLRADLALPPPAAPDSPGTDPGESPGKAFSDTVSTFQYVQIMESRAAAPRRIASIRAVRLGECDWGSVDADDVLISQRQRMASVDRAWRCAFEDEHSTTTRGNVAATGLGYFYKHGDRWLMATDRKDRESYKEVAR
ncbi:hypothetical protein [Sphingomicrobium flavum]|uniref:hypothetical protein n=1 Tax=Sphingomicrobium flavum TaxID=1229164 RepID=UPI0021ADB091|nr:hypothetical protein [Sphingomicrobium flavum]